MKGIKSINDFINLFFFSFQFDDFYPEQWRSYELAFCCVLRINERQLFD